MSRTRRVYIESACYHVMTRGNQKQTVFVETTDFIKYLSILKKAKMRYEVFVYAYCLMPNHVHLLIEPQITNNISKFMHWVNRGYTAYFNLKYEKVGHLWQGRFRSKTIIKDKYLLQCAAYIEENPIRAGLSEDIAKYHWSSYNDRCLAWNKSILDDIAQLL